MNEIEKMEKIEELRMELYKLFESYTSREALEISRELDLYIVSFQKNIFVTNGQKPIY
jgi:hypothetical protein